MDNLAEWVRLDIVEEYDWLQIMCCYFAKLIMRQLCSFCGGARMR